MNKPDFATLGIFLLIILALALSFYQFYIDEVNECTSQPLVYGAEKMEREYGFKFTGVGYLNVPIDYKLPRITFNSTSLTID